MINMSQIRELCVYMEKIDGYVLHHEIKCGGMQFWYGHYLPWNKLYKRKNPNTIKRYRQRSLTELLDCIVKAGLSVSDIESLPMPENGHYRPEDCGFIV